MGYKLSRNERYHGEIRMIEKILKDWVSIVGKEPDYNNEDHLFALGSTLTEQGWDSDSIGMLLQNLRERDLVKNKESGNVYPVQKHNPSTQDLIKKDATEDDIAKAEKGEPIDTDDDKKDTEEKSVGYQYKKISKVDTIKEKPFTESLETSDEDFEKANEKTKTPRTFKMSEQSEKALSKIPSKYRTLLNRVMNTAASVKNPKTGKTESTNVGGKLGFFGVGAGGAGQSKAQMGELMTMMFSTLDTEGLFGEKQDGLHQGGLFRDMIDHLDELQGQGVKTHIDSSWVRAAMENRSALMAYMREEQGEGYEVVATAWDVREEVEALGLDYDKKQNTTDMFMKVRDKDGNEKVIEVSLKKGFAANLYNGTIGDVIKNADTTLNVDEFSEKQNNSLDNNYDKKQKQIVSSLNGISLGSQESEDIIDAVAQKMGKDDSTRGLIRKQLEHSLPKIQEDLISNPDLKIDRDYIGNVTQAGVKKGKFTKEKRGVNKIMLALLETAGQVNENIAGAVQKHRQITKDFQDDAIKEISKNESFKAAVLDKCKENLPLQDILEGKEIMAAGQTPVTRKSLIDMFGTDNWDEVKQKTSVDAGPPPSLVYSGDIEGKPPIKFANINIREDGQGYSGGPGSIKFEIKFNNNFRDNASNSADDIYTEFRPEGGQIPIRYKKNKKSN